MGSVTYDYDGETVIVTGGSSGIGRETAFRFADAGATVINADVRAGPKDEDASEPTHEHIESQGGRAEFVRTDVSDPDELAGVVEAAREFGGVDVMVNNAATYFPESFVDVSPEQLEKILSINVGGVFFGTQAAARDMRERGEGGVILNTASISSDLAQHDQVHYDATKGAIRMITRGAALELAADDIRVNAVAPGQIATEFFEGWTEEAERGAREDAFYKPVPLGRAGHPEDVAGAFCYLASEDASYVTGELVFVDGGWQIA